MENKQQMVAVTVYQATVKFEGEWYSSKESKSIDDALSFLKRAREAAKTVNLPCNLIKKTAYEVAQ